MADQEPFRTTLIVPMELLEKIDDLLHEAKKRGDVPRNMHRNPFMTKLIEERADQLIAQHAKPTNSKKRSTD